jgi:hypothetical protein
VNKQISDTEDDQDVVLEDDLSQADDNHVDEVIDQQLNENSGSDNDETENQPTRARRPPPYLRDYVTGAEDSENEHDQLQNLAIAMFSSSEDPTTYEEAVKLEQWRNAMDS